MTADEHSYKVAIIGAGMVGAASAYALTLRHTAHDIVLIDKNQERAKGEAMDLNHCLALAQPMDISAGGFESCRDADVVVITAGAAQKPGETRLDLTRKNADIVKSIVADVMDHNPSPLFLVVSNPVDILSYVVFRESGLPAHRVIGSGTLLDSSRFRYLLSDHCGLDPRSIHAYVVGEHGDSEVLLWSQVHVAGVRLNDYCPVCPKECTPDFRGRIQDQVRRAAYEIIAFKGATYWAIGLVVQRIVAALEADQKSVLTVSTMVDGRYGIRDVYLSLPSVLGQEGVKQVITGPLVDDETKALQKSAGVLREQLTSLGY
jgi:L-lactate dehydrogenase